MQKHQSLVRRSAYLALIRECRNMREAKQIHSQIITSPWLVQNDRDFLIYRIVFFSALSDSGCVRYAKHIFFSIKIPNIHVYNIMIRAYSSNIRDGYHCRSYQSLLLYKQMICEGVTPNYLTVPLLIKECTWRKDIDIGLCIQGQVIRFGLYRNLYIQNSLITFFAACRYMDSAQKLFDEMFVKDNVSWNVMLVAYLKNSNLDNAENFFRRMKKRNIVSWNSIITRFIQGGRSKEALELFHEMLLPLSHDSREVNVKPDKFTIASALSACAYLGAVDVGRWVHDYLMSAGLECDTVVGTALVNMYGKCGCLERAMEVFREMPKKDTLAWTAMISVFALHGYDKDAFDTFKAMQSQGVKPNHVTFVGLLSACVHSGLVQKGRWCFNLMKRVYLIEPYGYHYACMVNTLSRAGYLEEAERLVISMPTGPDVHVWGALLGGCQMHGDSWLGEKVAQHLIDLDPLNHAFYVSLCDIYAKANKLNELKIIRAIMKKEG